MSLKLLFASSAAIAVLAATPCFALSVTQAPAKSENDGVAGYLGKGMDNLAQAVGGSSQAPTDRATEHGAMVTYDLGSRPLASQATPGRDMVAAHPTDPNANPFLASFDAPADRGPDRP